MSTKNLAPELANAGPLTPITNQTSNYTAGANQIIPVDATSGSIIVTLPTALADKTRIIVKKIDTSSYTVTIQLSGSDVLNKSGGSTSATLSLVNQSIALQYSITTGIWYVTTDGLPLSALDVRYSTPSSVTSAIAAQSTTDQATFVTKPTGGTTGQALVKQSNGSIAWAAPDAIGNGTLLDVSLGTGNGTASMQSIGGGFFATVNMPTVTTDAAATYNSSTSLYTIPVTGTHLIIAKIRPLDGTGTTTQANFGIGVNTSNADFPGFVWNTRGAPSTSATRWVIDYQRLGMFTAGQQVRLFIYADIGGSNNISINSANLTMIRLA